MSTVHRPIIYEVGKRSKKAIKALKQGRGRLLDEIHASINSGGDPARKILPVILLVRERPKKPKPQGFWPGFPSR
ncbi:MAG: hypothetical protein U1E65_30855 [Myxococcota bacterium]